MDIHYRHILQICHIYSHIEHHSISSFINKSSAILNVKAIDSRVNCLCALCSMCVLDEYSVRIEYSERWACCTQPLSHSPVFLSGRNIPMTTVTTTMIVMHDFINIDAIECWRWERESATMIIIANMKIVKFIQLLEFSSGSCTDMNCMRAYFAHSYQLWLTIALALSLSLPLYPPILLSSAHSFASRRLHIAHVLLDQCRYLPILHKMQRRL